MDNFKDKVKKIGDQLDPIKNNGALGGAWKNRRVYGGSKGPGWHEMDMMTGLPARVLNAISYEFKLLGKDAIPQYLKDTSLNPLHTRAVAAEAHFKNWVINEYGISREWMDAHFMMGRPDGTSVAIYGPKFGDSPLGDIKARRKHADDRAISLTHQLMDAYKASLQNAAGGRRGR